MISILWIVCYVGVVACLPQVAFPFNSQVPTVAIVSQPYIFQFAEATFQPDTGNLTYSLVNAPGWLDLDSPSRTLTGTPDQDNNGTNTFAIKATDISGDVEMTCTLVVTEAPGLRLSGDVSSQLAIAGALSGPSTLSLHPGDAFSLAFDNDTFQGSPILAHYATMADHTPLASWIGFDAESLAFFGVAPTLSVESQAYGIDLIASDVVGFAGAVAPFTLLVSRNQFSFQPQQEALNITAGTSINITDLLSQLYLNGISVIQGQIGSVTSSGPSWLYLDHETLVVTGTPPDGVTAQEMNITVQDALGDTAIKTLILRTQNDSLFDGSVGTLTAIEGKSFVYDLPETLFSQTGLAISVSIPASDSWLSFNATSMQIMGTPPLSAINTKVEATLTAVSSTLSTSENQTFTIQVVSSATSTTATLTPLPRTTASSSPAPSPKPDIIGETQTRKLGAGAIAGIVIGSLILLFFLALLAVALSRCFKKEDVPTPPLEKREISRPILQPNYDWTEFDQERGLQGLDQTAMRQSYEPPPQVHLNITSSPIRASKLGTGMSIASSIGAAGEAAIRADDNIPVFGVLHIKARSRHDSYSAATELTRMSTMGKSAQSKRSSWKQLTNRHSRPSVGLGIEMDSQKGSVRHMPSNKQGSRSRFSLDRDVSTVGTFDTHAASLVATKVRTRSTSPSKRMSKFISGRHAPVDMNRRSVRLVEKSNPSIKDTRSFLEKRQSYIRNRASSGVPSALFTTMSRDDATRETISSISPLNSRMHSKTYSASSSLEPPIRNPRRIQPRATSSFAPNYPRAIAVHKDDSPTHGPSQTNPDPNPNDRDSMYTTTNSSLTSSDNDLQSQLALPRSQRAFVLPGEASPTPSPSLAYANTSSASRDAVRRRWAARLNRNSSGALAGRSSSPLARRESSIRQPLGLISNDSIGRVGKRPVSARKGVLVRSRVRDAERLISDGSGIAFI